MTSPDTMAGMREHVRQASRQFSRMLYTEPVLAVAAALLSDWCAVAERYDPDLTGFRGQERVAGLATFAIEIARDQCRKPVPATADEAVVLLDDVVSHLAQRGIGTARDVLYVSLPRTNTTPAWGAFEPRGLAITIDIERGWELVIDQPGPSPVVDLVGRCDTNGIDAMLDLAVTVNAGTYGNVFR